MNDQPNTTLKLISGGGAGACVIILVWSLKTWAGVEMPDYVQMAMSTVISLGAAHFTPVDPPKP